MVLAPQFVSTYTLWLKSGKGSDIRDLFLLLESKEPKKVVRGEQDRSMCAGYS